MNITHLDKLKSDMMTITFRPPPDTRISTEEYAALSKSFQCPHVDGAKPRWRTEKKQAVWLQCLNCGATVGKAIKQSTMSPLQLCSLEMWDEALAKKHNELWMQVYELKKQEKEMGWTAWYNDYLDSPAWKVKREAVLKRDNRWCQGCREKHATQVHHLSYKHVGKELLFELTSVCSDCHVVIHPHMELPEPLMQNGH